MGRNLGFVAPMLSLEVSNGLTLSVTVLQLALPELSVLCVLKYEVPQSELAASEILFTFYIRVCICFQL